MPDITPQELNALALTRGPVSLLDVRTPAEFAEVHATGAINVPLDRLTVSSVREALPHAGAAPIYILCRSGARAEIAAEKLASAGAPHGIVVKGGTLAWKAAGLPVEESPVRAISLERQVRIGAGALVLIGVAFALLAHPAFLALSAFVGLGLVFAGITDWCGLGLLLAKAPWNHNRA